MRSPTRTSAVQSPLNLTKVIGTTTFSPCGFSVHEVSKSFAYCAGSAVVYAELNEEASIVQSFYKARPTALAINHTASIYENSPASNTPERRRRSIAPIRTRGQGYSPSSSTSPWNDGNSSKTWTSRERTKTATAVSISPDGRYLAVGEVCDTAVGLVKHLLTVSDRIQSPDSDLFHIARNPERYPDHYSLRALVWREGYSVQPELTISCYNRGYERRLPFHLGYQLEEWVSKAGLNKQMYCFRQ